jgi:hypothetical protein
MSAKSRNQYYRLYTITGESMHSNDSDRNVLRCRSATLFTFILGSKHRLIRDKVKFPMSFAAIYCTQCAYLCFVEIVIDVDCWLANKREVLYVLCFFFSNFIKQNENDCFTKLTFYQRWKQFILVSIRFCNILILNPYNR